MTPNSSSRGRGALALALLAATSACAARSSAPDPLARAPVEGGHLAYAFAGAGPTLVLINGGGMDFRQWDLVVPALARECRVLRFDPRGWGGSSAPSAPYSNADDLAALLDALDVERATVLGCSFGGSVAIDFALAHPERVEALILLGAALGGFPWSQEFIERERRFNMAPEAERVELVLDDAHFLPQARTDARLRERGRALLEENRQLYRSDFSLLRPLDPPAIERLGEIRVPALVLAPELDHPDVLAIARLLADRIPAARSLSIPGAGHMAHLEQPEAVTRAVLSFLREIGSDS